MAEWVEPTSFSRWFLVDFSDHEIASGVPPAVDASCEAVKAERPGTTAGMKGASHVCVQPAQLGKITQQVHGSAMLPASTMGTKDGLRLVCATVWKTKRNDGIKWTQTVIDGYVWSPNYWKIAI